MKAVPGTFAVVPLSIIYDLELGVLAVRLAGAIARYRNFETGECWPSVATLSSDLGVQSRAVQKAREQLVRRGHLIVKQGNGRASNTYHLVFGEVSKSDTPVRNEHPSKTVTRGVRAEHPGASGSAGEGRPQRTPKQTMEGTMEDFAAAAHDLRTGAVDAESLENAANAERRLRQRKQSSKLFVDIWGPKRRPYRRRQPPS